MKDVKIAKQVEYRKQTQQSHYGPSQQQDRQYGRNDNNKRSNTPYGRDKYQENVHEMIADDHPREIAPTPTRAVRAAQAITTKMVQHSRMTKRNFKISQQHLTSRSTTEIHQTHAV
jgi:hypothetical protein